MRPGRPLPPKAQPRVFVRRRPARWGPAELGLHLLLAACLGLLVSATAWFAPGRPLSLAPGVAICQRAPTDRELGLLARAPGVAVPALAREQASRRPRRT